MLSLSGVAGAQGDAEAASLQWRVVADQIRPKVPELAAILDDAEPNVLAYMTFPKEHRVKLHSANLIERLIKRRTDVVGIFPNDDASCVSSERCCSNTTMNGPSSAPAPRRWKASAS